MKPFGRRFTRTSANYDQEAQLRIRLSQTLISLASDGITDPRELRLKALETVALSG